LVVPADAVGERVGPAASDGAAPAVEGLRLVVVSAGPPAEPEADEPIVLLLPALLALVPPEELPTDGAVLAEPADPIPAEPMPEDPIPDEPMPGEPAPAAPDEPMAVLPRFMQGAVALEPESELPGAVVPGELPMVPAPMPGLPLVPDPMLEPALEPPLAPGVCADTSPAVASATAATRAARGVGWKVMARSPFMGS
jgi:nicotinate-nucleotide--dimethylbenzimidazole phosphoribosyltransferase